MRRPSPRTSHLVWGLSLAACSSADDPHGSMTPHATPRTAAAVTTSVSAEASSTPARPPPVDVDVDAELGRRAVGGEHPDGEHVGRKVLFSWTTEAQLKELEDGAALYTRTVSASRGPSAFDDYLSIETERGNRFAKLLFSEGYAKKRFAWPSPYATITGEADGSYGPVLLRIELKDEALILDFSSGIAYGTDGKKHAFEEVLEHPELLAGALFNGNRYREYVLFNESMVARFSGGGAKDVQAAMRADAEFLLATADAIEAERATKPGLPSRLAALVDGTLAYFEKLTLDGMRSRAKLLDTYRSASKGLVERSPKAAFAKGAVRAPLPPVCKVATRTSRQQKRFQGSYSMPGRGTSYTIYSVTCSPANPSVQCISTEGTAPKEATCSPVPVFLQ